MPRFEPQEIYLVAYDEHWVEIARVQIASRPDADGRIAGRTVDHFSAPPGSILRLEETEGRYPGL